MNPKMNQHYFSLLSLLHYSGQEVETRGLKTRELRRVLLKVAGYNAISVAEHRDWKNIYQYLFAEMAWFLSGDRNISKILEYSKFWEQIVNPDGTANSQYGDLVFYRKNSHGLSSFEWALRALQEDRNTRKAIILYNDREFFFPQNKDLICNQYQHFFIRNGQLDCDVALRSSDAIYGLTFNIPWWSFVHQQLYLSLYGQYPDLKLGDIIAFIGSSHIYSDKYALVGKMLSGLKESRFLHLKYPVPLRKSFDWYLENLPKIFAEDKEKFIIIP